MKKNNVCFFTKMFDHKMWCHDFVKWTGALPVLVDLRIKRIYCANGKVCKKKHGLLFGKYIAISNHISYIDPIIISNALWERRVSFIATKELFQYKFLGRFLRACGEIEVNKENISMETFNAVKERINRGHIVAVFPEGGIETEDQISGFKSGVVLMALMSDAPILPIYIEKRESKYKRQRVYIGEKIYIKKSCDSATPSLKDIQTVVEKLREKEIELEEISKNGGKI